MTPQPREFSKIWRSHTQPELELLKASFRQFSFNKHWHEELAVGVIERGAEGLNYRGSNILVPQHQIVAINPGEVHTGYAGTENGWQYRMFYFDTKLVTRCLGEQRTNGTPTLTGPIIDDPHLFTQLLTLHQTLELNSLDMTQDSLLTLALQNLFKRHGQSSQSALEKVDQKAAILSRDYLQANWQENIALDKLCHLTGLGRFQLIRSFKRQYGIAPHQYLLLLKVQHARHLLQSGSSCVDTALHCGFFDQSHLNRNFKNVFGVSPGRYIRAI